MQYKNVFGSYVPAYLLIKLRTTDPLHHINKIDVRDQRDFVHEYTHFLQDITGGFGHSHIWNTYDRLRQVIAGQQKDGNTELHLPVKNAVTEHERNITEVMKAIEGSYRVGTGIDDATAFVEGCNFYIEPSFKKLHPRKGPPFFLNLHLKDVKGRKANYLFGEAAVSEMMAYLIETKYFGESALNNFPYKVCQKVGEYLETDLVENNEWLFALCDVAMISNYPGMMFYRILQNMARRKFVPQSAEEIYDYGISYMYSQGWSVFEDFRDNKNGAIKVLEDLFRSDFLKNTVEWFKHLLEKGYESRVKKPSFLIDLYRQPNPFEGFWNDMYVIFGTPQLHNGELQRFFAPPHCMKHLESTIEPLFLLSAQQVHDTLLHKKSNCDMLECCRQSTIDIEVDYDCTTAPWERSNKDKACAYTALWVSYGLHNKQVLVAE